MGTAWLMIASFIVGAVVGVLYAAHSANAQIMRGDLGPWPPWRKSGRNTTETEPEPPETEEEVRP